MPATPARPRLEPLADRTAPAALAAGAEFAVNSFTAGDQADPAVAANAAGQFAVVWQSPGRDGSGSAVVARTYAPFGAAVTGEVLVNATAAGDQRAPAVAVRGDGGLVVAWAGNGPGDASGVFVRRLTFTGVALGPDVRVNTFTPGDQSAPAVAADAAGNFVVAWQSAGQDGSGLGVYARRFNANGQALGGEFRVNVGVPGDQSAPAVAVGPAGFVVAWQSHDESGRGVLARRYAAAGQPLGGQFVVNAVRAGDQTDPAVAIDPATGRFVVAWEGPAAAGRAVFARPFDANGAALNPGDVPARPAARPQTDPAVAYDRLGRFTLAWTEVGADAAGTAVLARQFAPRGAAVTPARLVNATGTGDQRAAAVAASGSGGLVVAWASAGQDGDGDAVVARRLAPVADGATAVGSPAGVASSVQFFAANGRRLWAVSPYGAYRGGVRVATGDVTGDGVLDVITAPGPGPRQPIKVFDGRNGALVRAFDAFPPQFTGGLWVAAGDADGDRKAEIFVGLGNANTVRVFRPDGRLVRGFGTVFGRGVRVAAADVDGDLRAELVAVDAAGSIQGAWVYRPLSGARVTVVSTAASAAGLFVAAGDLDGDGRAEVLTAPAAGPARVTAVSGATGQLLYLATLEDFPAAGVSLAASDLNGDGRAELTVGSRSGPAVVRRLVGHDPGRLVGQLALNPTFLGGVFVG